MKLSGFNRGVHRYLGLFLAPWMLMYAISAVMMNHREFLAEHFGEGARFYKEAEREYGRDFAADEDSGVVAETILRDLGMEGTYGVQGNMKGKEITIRRQSSLRARRIVYSPGEKKIVVWRQAFSFRGLLNELHHRVGYRQEYAAADLWGLAVDIVILAIFWWVISGLWMVWKIKNVRRTAFLCLAAGAGLFVFFVLVIWARSGWLEFSYYQQADTSLRGDVPAAVLSKVRGECDILVAFKLFQ